MVIQGIPGILPGIPQVSSMEAPLPLVVYVTPSAIQRLSRHGALKPRWRLEVLEGVGWSLKQRAIGRRWFLSSEIMCIYIYIEICIECHMYLWYLLVNAMYIQILRRFFFQIMDRIEIRFNSPFLAVVPACFVSDFTTNIHRAKEKGLRECWNFCRRNFLVRTI